MKFQTPAKMIGLLVILSMAFVTASAGTAVPEFRAEDIDGRAFDLQEMTGRPVLIHIANIENPICRDCEKSIKGQLEEIQKLKEEYPDSAVVTLNMRKNPYSKDGRYLSEEWWGIDVTWPWVEDMEPYAIAGRYIDYCTLDRGLCNPTLILVDPSGSVSDVIHVYKVGEGEVEGVQTADSLYDKLQALKAGGDTGLDIDIPGQGVSAFGMFTLGIVTSLAPCSIALMIAMFSYVMIYRRKEEAAKTGGSGASVASSSKEGLMMGVAFTLGLGVVFFVIGLFVSQMGMLIRDAKIFDLAAGIVMILLGVSNFKPLSEIISPLTSPVISLVRRGGDDSHGDRESLPQRAVGVSLGLFRYSAFIGAFSLGIFFALGWAPCAVSMVFPVLIWLSAQNITPLAGGLMLAIFGLGHGVPIIPISTFSRTLGGRIGDSYVSIGQWTTRFFGLLVIIVGVVYAARYFGIVFW